MTTNNDIIDNLIKTRVNEIVDDIVIDKVNEIVTRELKFYAEKATLNFWSDLDLPRKKHRERMELMFEAVKKLSEMKHSPLKTCIKLVADDCIKEQYKDFSFKLKIDKNFLI